MKKLRNFLETELKGLALKKAEWGHLTNEDDSRERTLLEVFEMAKEANKRHEEAMKEMAKKAWDAAIDLYSYPDDETDEMFEEWYNEEYGSGK